MIFSAPVVVIILIFGSLSHGAAAGIWKTRDTKAAVSSALRNTRVFARAVQVDLSSHLPLPSIALNQLP
jgi:hypothetical protein